MCQNLRRFSAESVKDVPLLATDIPQRQIVADIMGQNLTLFDSSDRAALQIASCYEKLFKEAHLG